MDAAGDSLEQKTEIIDRFLEVVSEDLLYWDYAGEQTTPEGRQRVYTKEVVDGKAVEDSECYIRVQCLIKGA